MMTLPYSYRMACLVAGLESARNSQAIAKRAGAPVEGWRRFEVAVMDAIEAEEQGVPDPAAVASDPTPAADPAAGFPWWSFTKLAVVGGSVFLFLVRLLTVLLESWGIPVV